MTHGIQSSLTIGRALFAFAAAMAPTLAVSDDRPPNIIHIIADDVGYDDIGPFGCKDIPTPNLDRMARQGMKFTSFYSPSPVCTPSRAAILTGCYAPRVGLPNVLFPYSQIGIHDDEVTIAELLKTRGYATALVGKWHLGHQPQFLPTRHGFDFFFGIPYPNDHEPVRVIWEKQAGKPDWRPPPMPLYRGDQIEEEPADLERCPHRFVVEAVKFIRENKNQPFYLHVANIETHTPYFVASRFQGFTQGGAYCDAVVSLDWMVGEIEAALINLGLVENTLVVFTSDNGPLLENHADLPAVYGRYGTTNTDRKHLLRGAKGSVWEGGVRVACLMKWPSQGKIPAGSLNNELVAGFDLYTTFAMIAGAELPTNRTIDGKDIRPLMFAEPGAKSPHDAFYYYQANRLGGVRQGKWKLMLGPGGGMGAAIKKANDTKLERWPQLFDLESDISETRNLAAEHPAIVRRLEALAEHARNDLGDAATNRKGHSVREPGRVDAVEK